MGPEPGKLVAIARRGASRAPMEELGEAAVSPEEGLDGDSRGARRFASGARQVTVVSRESWEAACAALGAVVPWTTRRANLLVEGLDLAETTGKRLKIGPVELEVTQETGPCTRMDEQVQGLTAALQPDWRGGVSCRVVAGGAIKVGDPVALV